MMNRTQSRQTKRSGAVAPLVVILLMPLLAMVAFSVDTGYVCVVKAELQNAADSAALAGASQLLFAEFPTDSSSDDDSDDSTGGGSSGSGSSGGKGNGKKGSSSTVSTSATTVSTSLSPPDPREAIAAAMSEAKKFSKFNYGGSVALDLKDADINVGYQDSDTSSFRTLLSSDWFPNAVQVTLRRDKTANNPVPLFVAPVLGISNWNGTATATARVKSDMRSITGYKSWPGGPNATLLPITVHIDTWNNFLKTGKSPDGSVHDEYKVKLPLTSKDWAGNVAPSATGDGTPEAAGVYPDRTTPGNFGLIRLDPTASPSANNSERWILNGPTAEELGRFGPDGLQATVDQPATVPAMPGLKSSNVPDFEAIIGQPRSIPLYTSYSEKGGSNTTYTIVGFAGVTVVKAQGRGSNIDISFQPVITIDPTATPGSGESNVSRFIYADSPIVLTK